MEDEKKHIIQGQLIPMNSGAIQFKEVFEMYHAALCYFAEKLVLDRTEAEDIVEEVFIKLWQKEPDFNKHSNIKAILYLAVKNACFNHLKQRRRKNANQHVFAYTLQHETESFALLEMVRSEMLRELYAELEKLPIERRTVMQLIFVEGWDSRKVAEHLDISIHTVKKHKLRGIKDLKEGWVGFVCLIINMIGIPY